MNTRYFSSTLVRLVAGAAMVMSTAGCGGELLRASRSPVYLVVRNVVGQPGGGAGEASTFLLSDVEVIVEQDINGQKVRVPTYFNDSATVTVGAELKNPTLAATAVNSVTLTRYHVTFRRTDGRNTPGVDVPYSIDGAAGVTVSPGSTADVVIDLVRHQAKLEPPLRNLRSAGGQIFISTIAEITIYGRDQNGNEISTTAAMDVRFGDFADEQ
jgi:hypothetical protein